MNGKKTDGNLSQDKTNSTRPCWHHLSQITGFMMRVPGIFWIPQESYLVSWKLWTFLRFKFWRSAVGVKEIRWWERDRMLKWGHSRHRFWWSFLHILEEHWLVLSTQIPGFYRTSARRHARETVSSRFAHDSVQMEAGNVIIWSSGIPDRVWLEAFWADPDCSDLRCREYICTFVFVM